MQKTHENFRQLAIIGATASGKTSLAIKVAQKHDAYILSLDSLAIYKEIDIVSAKPTLEERQGIPHFGIDIIYPNEPFNVNIFIDLYNDVYQKCLQDHKNLVIVGGTGFYLKMLIDGISEVPKVSETTKSEAKVHLKDLSTAYGWLSSLDPTYMSNIEQTDSYRIEKALHIYLESGLIPSKYFTLFSPKVTITQPLPIYQILWDKEKLRKRIALRTTLMIEDGVIDEVCLLEQKYGRAPNSMKSIGIKETLAYLDGIYSKDTLAQKITTNTARLAKRQNTFNNSQFKDILKGSVEELERLLLQE